MNRQAVLTHLRQTAAGAWMAHQVTCAGCREETFRLLRGEDPETAPAYCDEGQALLDQLQALLELG